MLKLIFMSPKKQSIIEDAYQKAESVLRACAKSVGFYASGLPGGYEAIWARDSIIASLGASLLGAEFKPAFTKSIETLSKNQSVLGQIPNCVGSFNDDRQSDVTFNSIDSTLWYLIGQKIYLQAYDNFLQEKYKNNIAQALSWLKHQDPDEVGVLAQQPTMDWQDAFPHKYGYVINTQALYYAALKQTGDESSAENLKKIINGERAKYISLYDEKLGYYWPWGWKNHNAYREHEEWFDTLGNLLAIITGLATPAIAKSILRFMEKEKINKPYPCKCIWPPIKKGDKAWHDYFADCDARLPYHYSNAGVWTFIGGFYVAALIKTGEFKKAQAELEKLAVANLQKLDGYEFNEWLDGKTGKPQGGGYQAWSAGMFIYASECVKQKKVLWF
jgi:glycogen debranching enzyme